MNSANHPEQQALRDAARAYALNGYIKLTNLFSRSEIEAISKIYDEYHSSVPRITCNGENRIPPTGSLLENSPELTEIIFAKSELMNVVRAATGTDVQFAGSDAVHVYNDSVGIHRDTFYKLDFPKVLIFLSDTPSKTNFADPIERTHAGAFMVMPGTHTLNDEYASLSSRLCDWPYDKSNIYSGVNPDFTFVEADRNSTLAGKRLAQEQKNRNKYSAFTKISFRKGDVVLFSTRILHALYPLFDTGQKPTQEEGANIRFKGLDFLPGQRKQLTHKPLKLLGILLVEGYSVQNGELLEDAIEKAEADITAMKKELIEYIATVYNLRLYNTIVDHGAEVSPTIFRTSGKAMGLNRSLAAIHNPETKSSVTRHNLIHAFYEKYPHQIDAAAGLNADNIFAKFMEYVRQHDDIVRLQDDRIASTLETLAKEQPSLAAGNLRRRTRWQGIAKYLPLIENEKAYLAYKKIAELLGHK